MNRRSFLYGLTALSAGSAAAVGSGAFSAVSAERRIAFQTVSDENAYLSISAVSGYARKTGETVIFEFDGESPPPTLGDGLGTDSIYEFTDVFFIQNSGADTVKIFSEYEDEKLADVDLLQTSEIDGSEETSGKQHALTEENPSDPLDPGEGVYIGFSINTMNIDSKTIDTSINIIASSEKSERYQE